MIAHNKTELENQFLCDEADSLCKAGFISKEEFNSISSKLITQKTQGKLLIRIGLALLGALLYLSACLFVSLLGLEVIEHSYDFFLFLFAIIGFAGVEFFVSQKNYGYGQEDAFIIGGQALFIVAIAVISNEDYVLTALLASVITLFAYLRYVNLYSALFFCISITATFIFSLFETGSIGKTILPFALMVFSFCFYAISQKFTKSVQCLFYNKGLILAKYFCLVLFYFSGNYLIVRQLSEILLETKIAPNQDIPFAIFFYAFTFVVPLFYIWKSLQLKNRAMLWIGLLSLGFSIYSIRFYYHVLPVSVALTLSGIVLFVIAYFSIKKLKDKTAGLTFQPDRFINSNDFIHTEALILTSQFGLQPETSVTSPMEFGGGGFSGGGSNGEF